ncbi:MAG: MBL fold hydrolase [Nitrospirota bacterium]|nr:MBL fold hydrolase [Nitrospirota bacterium]
MPDSVNMLGPKKIATDVHWVGTAAGEFLRRNVYLRTFRGKGRIFNLLVDPGPPCDLEAVVKNVKSLIGGIDNLHAITVNHQDPDVGANAAALVKMHDGIVVLMTEETWRLAQYYGISRRNFHAVEKLRDLRTLLPTGQKIQFVPTPFCHFRGACMVYDPESRILFSGDLFAGVAAASLEATASSWTGIKAFHQLYMPGNDALRLAVSRIRKLDPAPLAIAPQHGGVISGDLVPQFLEKMENLPVGLDIIASLRDSVPAIISALNDSLTALRDVLGKDRVVKVMRFFHPDGSYPALFTLADDDRVVDIKAEPYAAIEALLRILYRQCPDQHKEALRSRIWNIFLDRNLPPPESALVDVDVIEAEIVEG